MLVTICVKMEPRLRRGAGCLLFSQRVGMLSRIESLVFPPWSTTIGLDNGLEHGQRLVMLHQILLIHPMVSQWNMIPGQAPLSRNRD